MKDPGCLEERAPNKANDRPPKANTASGQHREEFTSQEKNQSSEAPHRSGTHTMLKRLTRRCRLQRSITDYTV